MYMSASVGRLQCHISLHSQAEPCCSTSSTVLHHSRTPYVLSRRMLHTSRPWQRVMVVCGGKKTKKSGDDASQPPPRRVNPDLNVSLKKQIAIAKVYKDLVSAPAPRPPVRQAYRRVKTQKTEHDKLLEAQADAKLNAQPLRPSFANLYGTKGKERPPALVVDGYNFLFKWRQTAEALANEQIEMHDARQKLIDAIGNYSQYRGVRTIVVFDALMGSMGTTRFTTNCAVEVVYSADCEADSYIALEVKRLQESGCPKVLVVTQDVDLLDSVSTYSSAWKLPIESFQKELSRVDVDIKDKLREKRMRGQIQWAAGRLGATLFAKNPEVMNSLTGGQQHYTVTRLETLMNSRRSQPKSPWKDDKKSKKRKSSDAGTLAGSDRGSDRGSEGSVDSGSEAESSYESGSDTEEGASSGEETALEPALEPACDEEAASEEAAFSQDAGLQEAGLHQEGLGMNVRLEEGVVEAPHERIARKGNGSAVGLGTNDNGVRSARQSRAMQRTQQQ